MRECAYVGDTSLFQQAPAAGRNVGFSRIIHKLHYLALSNTGSITLLVVPAVRCLSVIFRCVAASAFLRGVRSMFLLQPPCCKLLPSAFVVLNDCDNYCPC